jgi:hypothetical protein
VTSSPASPLNISPEEVRFANGRIFAAANPDNAVTFPLVRLSVGPSWANLTEARPRGHGKEGQRRFVHDSPLEGDGFELSLKIRPQENCGFRSLAISTIVPQPGAK